MRSNNTKLLLDNKTQLRNIEKHKIFSKCVKNKFEIQNLINLLRRMGYIIKTMIFRGTENGMNITSFHKYCDNKGPTLTLLYVKDNHNCLGAITRRPFLSQSKWETDPNAKIFNLSTN